VAHGFPPAIYQASAAAAGAVVLASLASTSSGPPVAALSLRLPVVQMVPRSFTSDVADPVRLGPRQMAAIELVQPAAAPLTTPPVWGGNRFFYGYCTWWVAQKRPIPWRGDAWQWWTNARLFGYPEAGAPRPGAIAVFRASGWSPAGHVAYVEMVHPDGSFVVSEMNWARWGMVDFRTITTSADIVGFIY
jgi:CHAP domain-containing protein